MDSSNKGWPPSYEIVYPTKEEVLQALGELKKLPFRNSHNCKIPKDRPDEFVCKKSLGRVTCGKRWKKTRSGYRRVS